MGAHNHTTVVPKGEQTAVEANPFRGRERKFIERKLAEVEDRGGVHAAAVRHAATRELRRRERRQS